MADVDIHIIQELWNATEFSTWEDLLKNLDEIYEYDVITTDQWEDLAYAIKKYLNLESPFPDSPGELKQLLDYYM